MERVRTIENARKGILPTELNKQSAKLLRRYKEKLKKFNFFFLNNKKINNFLIYYFIYLQFT